MDLIDALVPESEGTPLVCVVGAGGKKTTLYTLSNALDRAVVTATVRIPIFDEHVGEVRVTDDPVDAVAAHDGPWPLGVVPEREDDRYLGYETATVDALTETDVDAVLVKADGARMREFKAPDADEPRLPAASTAVLPIASVQVVGRPLTDDYVHRPERVAALTDREVGDTVRAEDVATVLTHPDGGCKGVPGDTTVVPVLNKVDDADWERTARTIARRIHERADVPYVALTHLRGGDLVAVV
ncbi:selenium cofactor biosynthesis protein YqeC [Halomarina ordinaria]|uniref:Selenium cofactor biosynthesis protein YqeC n=1 Tax=Halomarina ordinaria TaxID=3033939 RepID=A0ABD5U918_9EURY|nr:selenium cofactor biosynthesis protein YqeC [Halomarina sp. PSRA2]